MEEDDNEESDEIGEKNELEEFENKKKAKMQSNFNYTCTIQQKWNKESTWKICSFYI